MANPLWNPSKSLKSLPEIKKDTNYIWGMTPQEAQKHTHGVWVSCNTCQINICSVTGLTSLTYLSALRRRFHIPIGQEQLQNSSHVLSFNLLRSVPRLRCLANLGIFSWYFAHFCYCWEPFRGIFGTYYFIWPKCGLETQISHHDVITF